MSAAKAAGRAPTGGDGRDPERTMALLWRAGTDADPGRGERGGLSADRIVAAAVTLADADGFAGLSMRQIADRLGVGTMSLYTYVPTKADLVAAMRDLVLGETTVPDRSAGWRPALRGYAVDLNAMYHRHPWVLLAPCAQELLGPNETVRWEAALAAVAAAGLTEAQTVGVVLMVDGYARGVAALSVDSARTAARTGVSEAQWWAARSALLDRYVTAERFPTLRAVSGARAWEAQEAAGFDFGLDRVLDGIETLIAGR